MEAWRQEAGGRRAEGGGWKGGRTSDRAKESGRPYSCAPALARPPKFSPTLNSALTHSLPLFLLLLLPHSPVSVSRCQILSSVPEVPSPTKVSPPLIVFRQQGLSEPRPPPFQTNALLSFQTCPSIPPPSCWSRSEGSPFIFLLVRSITDAPVSFLQARPPPQRYLLNTNSLPVSFGIANPARSPIANFIRDSLLFCDRRHPPSTTTASSPTRLRRSNSQSTEGCTPKIAANHNNLSLIVNSCGRIAHLVSSVCIQLTIN